MITRKVSAQRLLKLAAFLEKLPRKRFDYTVWVGYDWKGSPTLDCGTTACALGWAAAMPSFRRLGLRIENDPSHPVQPAPVITYKGSRGSNIWIACEVFGVEYDQAMYLFTPGQVYELLPRSPGVHATPKQVAKHIRRFVATYRAPENKGKRDLSELAEV